MALSIKPGVKLLGVQPIMLFASHVVEGVYTEFGIDCVITSGTDGEHGNHSHHYKGLAFDFRTRNVPTYRLQTLFKLIQERLGSNFQVVLESDHIHVEYDPQ